MFATCGATVHGIIGLMKHIQLVHFSRLIAPLPQRPTTPPPPPPPPTPPKRTPSLLPFPTSCAPQDTATQIHIDWKGFLLDQFCKVVLEADHVRIAKCLYEPTDQSKRRLKHAGFTHL